MKKHVNGNLFDPDSGTVNNRKKAPAATDTCKRGHTMGEMDILRGECFKCHREDLNLLKYKGSNGRAGKSFEDPGEPATIMYYEWKGFDVEKRFEFDAWFWYHKETDNLRFINESRLFIYLHDMEAQREKQARSWKMLQERRGRAVERLYSPMKRKELEEKRENKNQN